MCSAGGVPILSGRVAPFGNPRLSLLDSSPRLIAVLPRPSSALDTKASTVCPYRLTCFRLDIRPHIKLLRYLMHSKSGSVTRTKPLAWLYHQPLLYVSTLFISTTTIILSTRFVNRDNITSESQCQHFSSGNVNLSYGVKQARFILCYSLSTTA